MRHAAALFLIALTALRAGAQGAAAPTDSEWRRQHSENLHSSEIDAVHAALKAQPMDCGAIGRAFTALSATGRNLGDVEAVVLARRTTSPCALAAADAAAKALAIPQAEVVAWVLSHPDAVPVQPLEMDAAEEELGVALDCGLLFIDRRIDEDPSGARLLLTMRNKTDRDIVGHDIVMKVNGQPWRSLVLPKDDESAEPPLGSAETLGWDTSSGSWQDRRATETRAIIFPARKEPEPMQGPVGPGGKFDVIVRVDGLTAETDTSKLAITFESCVLR